MDIYSSSDNVLLFKAPHNAKKLFNDSVERTLLGYRKICERSVWGGLAHILLARIESVAAFALIAFSGAYVLTLGTIVCSACILGVPIVKLITSIPGISSYQMMQDLGNLSNGVVSRSCQVAAIAIPAIFLFLSATSLNFFLPGLLQRENALFKLIDWTVRLLGPLQTICAIVPRQTKWIGTESKLSPLSEIEEYFRVLSYKNELREVQTNSVTHHFTRIVYV